MMLRKILLLMSLVFILSIGVACAAERTYEVTDGGCIVSLPEQYAVTVVERPTDPNDELGVQVAQLSISDPVNKSMTMHVMVESIKCNYLLPSLSIIFILSTSKSGCDYGGASRSRFLVL
jgi:hypothetical protein